MALGTRFIRADFGIKVGMQVAAATYLAPTKILCLEREKAELPTIDYKSYTCKPMDDVEYDVILDPATSKVTLSLDLALPKTASLGGVEDLLLACAMTKTDNTGELHFEPLLELGLGASIELTTKRRVYQIQDVKGSFDIEMIPGEIVRIKFEMQGNLVDTPVELISTDADNTIPVNYLGVEDIVWGKRKCGVTIGGSAVWAKTVNLSLGRNITDEETFCGIIPMDTGTKSELKVLMKVTEENEAPIADMATGAQYSVVVPGYDSVEALAFQILVPVGQVSTPDSETDNNGYWETERTFSARKTVADDNFDLVFTAP